MSYQCPSCSSPIDDKDINVQKNIFLCRNCKGIFPVSSLNKKHFPSPPRKLHELPPGVQKTMGTGNSTTYIFKKRTKESWSLLLFSLFWLLMSSVFVYASFFGKSTSGDIIFPRILSSFFACMGFVILILALIKLLAAHELMISRHQGKYTIKLGFFKSTQAFSLNPDTKIEQSAKDNKTKPSILLRNPDTQFGNLLPENIQEFFVQELNERDNLS